MQLEQLCVKLMANNDMENRIRIKAVYNGNMFVTYVAHEIDLDGLFSVVKEICEFPPDQVFTVKWMDEEADPCTISTRDEWDECLRLYELNKDSELLLHIFPSIPEKPGMPCPGEDRNYYHNIHRRGAMRRRKLYHVNGHIFQAKRFNRSATCSVCDDRIWGLGMQGFKCLTCKLKVHKRCHKMARGPCEAVLADNSFDHVSMVSSTFIENKRATESALPPAEFHRVSSRVLRPRNREAAVLAANGVSPKSSLSLVEPIAPSQPEEEVVTSSEKALSLDDFQLIRVIGRGSYAKVLVVELKSTKRIYAMKVIKKELIKEDEDIEWVNTEKKVFETASNYPFLVGLHSCFQTPSRLFFIIEFVSGGDMMFHMQRQRRLAESHAQFYSAEIILALSYLHKRGIIYRDLKLDNVLLDHDGHIKLTDYGMCKEGMLLPTDRTETFCGTPNYIAPEILQGKPYSFSVDWWALGVLMFEMLVGKSPFDITQTDNPDQNTEDYLFQVILEKQIRIPRSLRKQAGSVLAGFLMKDPDMRLGCHADTGLEDIESHAFFKTLDFKLLEAKQIAPPFKPSVDENNPSRDLNNFDPQFTKEPVQLTPDDRSVIAEIDQSEFDGFEYVNPLLMSSEDPV